MENSTFGVAFCFTNVPVGVEFLFGDVVYCRLNEYEADTVNYPAGNINRFSPNDVVHISPLDVPLQRFYELPENLKEKSE